MVITVASFGVVIVLIWLQQGKELKVSLKNSVQNPENNGALS